ncbi:hypothetical protein [Faecalibaculum rodentium]|uniref:hypothetical protein n=1 Tax=Faecalibaculum rodentium TaxID=1702221 RepID=UPI0027308B4B|nr:hypothetical protein [Faecalibaculum rodentium]
MTENKKDSIVQALKEMQYHLNEVKREAVFAQDVADEAESYASMAKNSAFRAADCAKAAEKQLRQLMDLLDDEVRP